MDISNIAPGQGPRRPDDGKLESVDLRGQRGGGVRETEAGADSFARSQRAVEARRLVDQLKEDDVLRQDLVDKFSALLAAGRLEEPGRVEQAVQAMLSGGAGPAES